MKGCSVSTLFQDIFMTLHSQGAEIDLLILFLVLRLRLGIFPASGSLHREAWGVRLKVSDAGPTDYTGIWGQVHAQHEPLRGIEGFRLAGEVAVDVMDHHPIHLHGFT